MRLFARLWALCAVAVLAGSPAMAGMLSLHLALEHHRGHEDREHAAAVRDVLHGHAHDESTPEHDHVVTSVSTLNGAPRTLAPAASPIAMPASVVTQGRGRLTEYVENGRQPRAGPPSELWPVLRI